MECKSEIYSLLMEKEYCKYFCCDHLIAYHITFVHPCFESIKHPVIWYCYMASITCSIYEKARGFMRDDMAFTQRDLAQVGGILRTQFSDVFCWEIPFVISFNKALL